MTIDRTIAHLEAQAAAIAALTRAVSDEQARWKPTPADWSLLEVINHLYDEERDDFRLRLDLTLHQPTADWPPIDPPGWAVARRYNERDFAQSVANFLAERQQSIAWLQSLAAADLESAHVHPRFGAMRAGELLAAWVAHDCLHIRQLNELRYRWWAAQSAPYGVEYAGDW